MSTEKKIQSLKVHMIAALDFKEAIEAIHMAELCLSVNERTSELLVNYAIIAYARPFCPGGNISGTRVSSKLEKLEDSEMQAIHQQILSLRNKVVGHNDSGYFEVNFIKPEKMTIKFTPDGASDGIVQEGTIDHTITRAHFKLMHLSRFKKLCELQKSRIETRVIENRQALEQELKLLSPLVGLSKLGLSFSKCTAEEVPPLSKG
jgi:hypothetical protein